MNDWMDECLNERMFVKYSLHTSETNWCKFLILLHRFVILYTNSSTKKHENVKTKITKNYSEFKIFFCLKVENERNPKNIIGNSTVVVHLFLNAGIQSKAHVIPTKCSFLFLWIFWIINTLKQKFTHDIQNT